MTPSAVQLYVAYKSNITWCDVIEVLDLDLVRSVDIGTASFMWCLCYLILSSWFVA